MEKSLSVEEIEQLLRFDSIKPITSTLSDEEDMIDKENELKDWYEYELTKFYKSASRH